MCLITPTGNLIACMKCKGIAEMTALSSVILPLIDVDELVTSFEQDVKIFELFQVQNITKIYSVVLEYFTWIKDMHYICGSKPEKYIVLQCDRDDKYHNARDVLLDERKKQ